MSFFPISFDLGLTETVLALALQIFCRRKIKEKTATFLKDGLSGNFSDIHQQNDFTALCAFIHSVVCLEGDDTAALPSSEQVLGLLVDYAKKEYIEGVVEGFFDLLLQWPRSRQNFIELKQLMDETSQDVVQVISGS